MRETHGWRSKEEGNDNEGRRSEVVVSSRNISCKLMTSKIDKIISVETQAIERCSIPCQDISCQSGTT